MIYNGRHWHGKDVLFSVFSLALVGSRSGDVVTIKIIYDGPYEALLWWGRCGGGAE